MQSKNIVFVKEKKAELISEDVCEPKLNEVSVRLAVSTISSGTERANLIGSKTVSWRCKEDDIAVFPRRGGYSSSGVITAVGNGVSNYNVGDRVALWWSNHNQFITISQDNIFNIGDISFEDAALFQISTFPMAAIRKCRLEMGESAIVMGMGVLGIVALKLLRTAGATPIIAVDPDEKKRKKALQCGADYALDPYSENFSETAKKLTGGGANVGIEVTGIGAGLDGILDCMAPFSRVALLGCTRSSDFTIDYYRKVHGPGITLIGAHTNARPLVESHSGWWTQRDDINAIFKLVKSGRLKLSDIIDETHSPDEAPEIYNRLANEKTFPLVQFDWSLLR